MEATFYENIELESKDARVRVLRRLVFVVLFVARLRLEWGFGLDLRGRDEY
jgi:hypothetical protein